MTNFENVTASLEALAKIIYEAKKHIPIYQNEKTCPFYKSCHELCDNDVMCDECITLWLKKDIVSFGKGDRLNALNEAVKHCNEALLSFSKNFEAIARQVHEIKESLVESREDKQVEQEVDKWGKQETEEDEK